MIDYERPLGGFNRDVLTVITQIHIYWKIPQSLCRVFFILHFEAVFEFTLWFSCMINFSSSLAILFFVHRIYLKCDCIGVFFVFLNSYRCIVLFLFCVVIL